MINKNLSIVIMAAGKGTRMGSDLPKILHTISGKTLLNHVIDIAQSLLPSHIIVILGYKSKMVQKSIVDSQILFSLQKEQKGTGHAVMQAKEHLKDFLGHTLVLSGDVPLITKETLLSLIKKQLENNFDASMLTAEIENPFGYGRVIRDEKGNLNQVKEHKDCKKEELSINEINTGIYIFNNQLLFSLLPGLDNENAQAEYYLPDVLSMIINNKGKIGLEKTNNIIEIQGINTLEQLSSVENNMINDKK